MKYFLDSNVFLRFLIHNPANEEIFEDCKRLFERIEQKKINCITASWVFAEIVWVLKSVYGFRKQQIITALRVCAASPIVIDNTVDHTLALSLYEKQKVKFIDCLIASHPQLQNKDITIISYDTDFDKLGVKRTEPEKLI